MERAHVHAEQLEATPGPEEMHGRAVAFWKRHYPPSSNDKEKEAGQHPIHGLQLVKKRGKARTKNVEHGEGVLDEGDAPVPRRKTQMWLMEPAAGSSNAAWVSSICWRLVWRRRPATQQPNMVLGALTGNSYVCLWDECGWRRRRK